MRIKYLDWFYLIALACGNFFGRRFVAVRLSGARLRPFQRSMNNFRRASVHAGDPIVARRRSAEASGAGKCEIPGSARYEHDNTRENTGGNPSSGQEKPELPSLVLFTPRNNKCESLSGEETTMEKPSWSCACN
jgi:hypothetical protein